MRRIKPTRKKKRAFVKAGKRSLAASTAGAARKRRVRAVAAASKAGSAGPVESARIGAGPLPAFWASALEMGTQLAESNQAYVRAATVRWWRLCATPWRLTGARPVDSGVAAVQQPAAVVNARRLTRVKKR